MFELPTVPPTVPPAPQPAAFRGTLFAYQRRSLARMLEIEGGTTFTVQIGVRSETFVPKGGVVADTVGMGKTAQLIALLLARPPARDDGSTLAALVLTPEHLCHQWRSELAKFAGGALGVQMVTNKEEMAALSPGAWSGRGGGTARVLIASLEHICRNCDVFDEQLAFAHALAFDRLILDECHDAVLLDGGASMGVLLHLQRRARRVWCVTGTPFPEGDRSVFGLHQLLGVNVNFVLSNSPFLKANRPLPPSHPFEQLKKLVYLRNTPASVGSEVEGSRLVEQAPHVIEVATLRFAPIERGFYDEAARRANTERGGDSFSARFDALRRLCCHPAVAAGWSERLNSEAEQRRQSGMQLLSLDEMRSRMVSWKAEEIGRARQALQTHTRQAAAACAAAKLVIEACPRLADAPGAERARERRPAVRLWRCIDYYGQRGAYHEERLSGARAWAASLDEQSARAFLLTTHDWLATSNEASIAASRDRISRAERELRYFQDEVSRQIEACGNEGDEGGGTCVICMDVPEGEVGVLPCGHCPGCAVCVRSWVAQAAACPTCRRAATVEQISFVALGAAAAAPTAVAAAAATVASAAVHPVDPDKVERWGTKPAAIIQHLQVVLAEAGSRAIVFSAFDECLARLAITFADAGVRAVRCEGDAAARHAAIAAFSDVSAANGPRVLLLSSKHNASGTNLQCANHVLFVEPPGTNATHGLSVETQAIGRTLRLGQTRQVRVKYFIVEDSIEQDIYAALQRVRDAASTTAAPPASSGPADSAEAAEQLSMDASTAVAHATAAVTPTAAVAGAYSNNTGPGTPAAVETSAASSARAAASVSPLSSEEDEPDVNLTQQSSRTMEATLDSDPEVQAVLLPSLCSCLRSELGLHQADDAATLQRACEVVGVPQAGTPLRRARACLEALCGGDW